MTQHTPELLEALKASIGTLEVQLDMMKHTPHLACIHAATSDVLAKSLAAIAKAEGK